MELVDGVVRVALLLVILLLSIGTDSASAATVSAVTTTVTHYGGKDMDEAYEVNATTVAVTALPGESNRIAMHTGSNVLGVAVTVTDGGSPLTAGDGCVASPDGSVGCSGPTGDLLVSVRLGDGDDSFVGTGRVAADVFGEAGNDSLQGAGTLSGGDGDDRLVGRTLSGDAGDDTLIALPRSASAAMDGGPGDDLLDACEASSALLTGGDGDDRLLGSPGSDVFTESEAVAGDDRISGGRGRDRISYSTRTQPVRVDLVDGRGGQGGEHDLIAGVEDVTGGRGDDLLRGTSGGNRLEGGPGDDVLLAGSGDDYAAGDEGRDVLRLGSGRDIADGGDNGDRIFGGPGRDEIGGRGGSDRIYGGPGRDDISPGEGVDRVDTGTGEGNLDLYGDYLIDAVTCHDPQATIRADVADRLRGPCGANVHRYTPEPLLDDPLRHGREGPHLEVGGNVVHLWVDCMDRLDTSCRGIVVLRHGAKTIARGNFGCFAHPSHDFDCTSITAGRGLHLGPDTLALLQRDGALPVTVILTLWPGRSRGGIPVRQRAELRAATPRPAPAS